LRNSAWSRRPQTNGGRIAIKRLGGDGAGNADAVGDGDGSAKPPICRRIAVNAG
jgi:hypothetical protein